MRIPKRMCGTLLSAYSTACCRRKAPAPEPIEALPEAVPDLPELSVDKPLKPAGEQSLIDEMLSQSRYALLLRPQIIGNLTPGQLIRTQAALADGMCLVPSGEVVLHPSADDEDGGNRFSNRRTPLRIDAYYLDRYPATNAQFQQFVACGGYEQLAIWDQEIWPAVLDFVDQTGHPGPRFWRKGGYPNGEANHPVVGICWYEARAYARWAGKRLGTDAEWVKAGSWPVSMAGHPLLERRYPWGDAMDRERANLWGSGPGRTVSVDQFPLGVSVGGVHQLIGNVWEWTADAFILEDAAPETNAAPQPKMKSVRGGAYDTYLDTQATCQFRSGDYALARKHNIGFRCAIGMCDLKNTDSSAEPGHLPQESPAIAEAPR
ncbi:MAG: SUMF1/EgtB/PvdO family nonheme iron enzyme [Planctomycetia bacterium]|nr:SUMF1/EgtB/PvdO family nonheme iron enzyme [Planctomycetia bacterium]